MNGVDIKLLRHSSFITTVL